MTDRWRWYTALTTILAFAAVGIVEAARQAAVGLAVMFAVVALVAVGLLASVRRRTPVALRSDLATWIEATSSITGESTSQLADRAVSAYRAALDDDRGG